MNLYNPPISNFCQYLLLIPICHGILSNPTTGTHCPSLMPVNDNATLQKTYPMLGGGHSKRVEFNQTTGRLNSLVDVTNLAPSGYTGSGGMQRRDDMQHDHTAIQVSVCGVLVYAHRSCQACPAYRFHRHHPWLQSRPDLFPSFCSLQYATVLFNTMVMWPALANFSEHTWWLPKIHT